MNNINKKSKWIFFMSCLSLITAFFVFTLTGCLDTEIPEITIDENNKTVSTQNTITVEGSGRIKVIPDEAFINISVITEKPTTQEAVDENSIITNNVISVIEKIEAEDLEIQTVGYDMYPLYSRASDEEPPEIYAYRVNTTVEVKTKDTEQIGKVISTATEAGATTISSIGFSLSDETRAQAKKEALTEATKDASDKALAIAQALRLKIERIIYISESEIIVPSLKMAPAGLGEKIADEIETPVILPEQIEVTATLTVVYLFTE